MKSDNIISPCQQTPVLSGENQPPSKCTQSQQSSKPLPPAARINTLVRDSAAACQTRAEEEEEEEKYVADRLLDLPPELRIRIYEELFPQEIVTLPQLPGILAWPQIRDEANNYFYALSVFVLHIDLALEWPECQPAEDMLSLAFESNRKRMTKIRFDVINSEQKSLWGFIQFARLFFFDCLLFRKFDKRRGLKTRADGEEDVDEGKQKGTAANVRFWSSPPNGGYVDMSDEHGLYVEIGTIEDARGVPDGEVTSLALSQIRNVAQYTARFVQQGGWEDDKSIADKISWCVHHFFMGWRGEKLVEQEMQFSIASELSVLGGLE